MHKRFQTADLLKGIAILFMIQVHLLELFASDPIYRSSLGKVLLFVGGPPVAPVFMIIFGFFIASSEKSLWPSVKRGIKIFVLGMFLNIALNFNLILSNYNGTFALNIWSYIFGVDILQFAGLSLILIALIKKIFEHKLILILPFIFVSTYLGDYLPAHVTQVSNLKYVCAFFYGCAEWSYFPLFPWLSFPLAGFGFYYVLQKNDWRFNFSVQSKIISGILFLVFFLVTMGYAFSVTSNLPLYYHHGVLFFLWLTIFLAFYILFVHWLNGIAGEFPVMKFLKWMGRNVTLIYVIQWVFIGNIATEIYKTLNSPLYLVLSFFAILSVSCFLTYAFLLVKERMGRKV